MALKNVLSQIVIPNVEVLKAALHKAVDSERHRDVDTRAYCVLSDTGLEEFLDRADKSARSEAQRLLIQYLANDDIAGAKKFLGELVDAVCEELIRQRDQRDGAETQVH